MRQRLIFLSQSLMASSRSPRIVWLSVFALVLGGFLLADRSGYWTPSNQAENFITAEESLWERNRDLHTEIAALQSWASQKTAIENAYFQNAGAYADRIAGMIAIAPAGAPMTETEVQQALGAKLDGYEALEDIKITVAPPSQSADNTIYSADIGFVTKSSAAAWQAISDLADPKAGAIWRQLSLTTDRTSRQLNVSGKLQIFALEAAE
jgi:hypothetical protein